MRLNCMIDGIQYELNVSPEKPLSKILEDKLESFAVNNQCKGASCGNCIVIVNGQCTMACLTPAYQLENASILTYAGFSKTKLCHDIEQAYEETGNKPCNKCYAAKTLILESIVEAILGSKQDFREKLKTRQKQKGTELSETEFIAREISINSCKCIEIPQLEKIIKLACKYRSKRRNESK